MLCKNIYYYPYFKNYTIDLWIYCLGNMAFQHVETLFIQGVCFYYTGLLSVCAIPPINSKPVQ